MRHLVSSQSHAPYGQVFILLAILHQSIGEAGGQWLLADTKMVLQKHK